MSRRFVSEAIEPAGAFDVASMSHGEPGLPPAFRWRDEDLPVVRVVRTWRSTKTDRGDVYLAKHWFEFETTNAAVATVYFERQAKRTQPRWYLYALED